MNETTETDTIDQAARDWLELLLASGERSGTDTPAVAETRTSAVA
jgi:hypothetical protein